MDENKKRKGREREKEREREKKLNILLFHETKPHDISLQPQRKKTELNGTTLKRISSLKRHAAVRIFAAEDNEISSAWKDVIPPLSDVRS